ncbi:unnamed protein product [Rotaria socialis]|uniref:Prolyl 4-hydroxylase alpha subunit Fe(2+) 2OG dioxygenase domain-containing protein n=1 Tax=Rotaria socialis TaxID=392032 RepID=A0A817QMR3_9BILA|nr:unnamed protein product [Rotaria socialis]CAF4154223.1 unnamed protein product [Rotaria socialis]
MTTIVTPMEITDDEDISSSDTDTWIYSDQESETSDREINEHNWRYNFQETINDLQENKLDDGARSLLFDVPYQIRIKQLGDAPFTFPLSNALCSRIICEHGVPLPLSNKYDFCGTKILNTAWQIDYSSIDFPLSFSAAIRASTFEQLHLNTSDIKTHFDLNLHKLIMFGPCSHTKIYHFDDKLFIYHATVLVFLPSNYTGGNYRFIDDNDDEEDDNDEKRIYRHVFNQHESVNSKPSVLVVPSDCQHEIEPIEKGFQLLLVYHLVSKTNSIHQFYSLLSNVNYESMNIEHVFLTQRIKRIFNYWEKNLDKMPNKLLIPLQHPLDYSPYFSILFRDKYRIILELIMAAMKYLSSFLICSAIFQYDRSSVNAVDSRFLIRDIKLLSKTNKITLDLTSQHERTVIPNEFLGELHTYVYAFEHNGGKQHGLNTDNSIFRNNTKYHVLVVIPYQRQWDLLLDDHSFAYHHLSYMLSLPINTLDNLCLNLFDCILHDKTTKKYSFDQIIRYLILLRHRFGLMPKMIPSIKTLFQNKQFKDELFSNNNLHFWLSRLAERFYDWPMFSKEFLDLFRKVIISSMPTKLNEIIQFLIQFTNKTLRALLINALIRFIFKPHEFSRHILLSTLCSIFHLLTIDQSYSDDALSILAYSIIKRVRKTTSEHEIIQKCFKIHLVPMLINIYRDKQEKANKNDPKNVMSPAFFLIYEYCLNTLNYYCSPISSSSSSSSLTMISMNEALLMCSCTLCSRLQMFLGDSKSSTLIFDLSSTLIPDHCLRHTLSKFPMLSIEYKHEPCTGREQTLIISKYAYEQEQKQLCFHLRRLLLRLHKI